MRALIPVNMFDTRSTGALMTIKAVKASVELSRWLAVAAAAARQSSASFMIVSFIKSAAIAVRPTLVTSPMATLGSMCQLYYYRKGLRPPHCVIFTYSMQWC